MTTYEMLLDEAYQLGLIVKEINLRTRKGRCVGNRIAIDKKIETAHEKACILREEIAHYLKTVGDISNQNIINNRKQENIARAEVIQNCCNPDMIINAVKNNLFHKYDIVDYLNITEELFDEAVEYYSRKIPQYTKDSITLYFNNQLYIFKEYIDYKN